jgi:2-polyprenyl-3-methyl-5-hydroxy-6-metoxy-1,4-benzoquinol methylase
MSESPAACCACGSSELTPFVSTRQIALHRCRACQGLTAVPRPTPHALTAHHDTDVYFNHPYFEHRRRDLARIEARCRDVVQRLRTAVPDFSPAGLRHLDVGCDTGLFLEAFARLHGTVPVGIDIAARAVAQARARGIEAYHTDLTRAPAELNNFALITLVDVIEHVADPIQLLREVRARLSADGVCYLETPNIRSVVYGLGRIIANLTGGRPRSLCERLFLPEHVQYFSEDGLAAMVRAADLRLLSVTRRRLGDGDVNATAPVRAAVRSLQSVDRLLGREILHCAVLVR